MKKVLIGFIIAGLFASGGYAVMRYQKYYKEPVPEAVDISKFQSVNGNASAANNAEKNNSSSSDTNSTSENNNLAKNLPVPPALNLKVPFYAQAPHGNWDYPWQEACEEASALLVANAYFNHNWTRDQFNEQILKLVNWEKKEFGDYKHTTVDQTADILSDYLQLKTQIHEHPTYEDVQRILARGHLIVMTFAGKELKNPFYKNGGPVYHAMVIKGYKEGEKIITNDVGTENGADYVYGWKTIQKALHDYAELISEGPKRFIEVFPPEMEES